MMTGCFQMKNHLRKKEACLNFERRRRLSVFNTQARFERRLYVGQTKATWDVPGRLFQLGQLNGKFLSGMTKNLKPLG
jgi:hypothetical protein